MFSSLRKEITSVVINLRFLLYNQKILIFVQSNMPLNIKVNAGTGGKVKNLTVAAAVTGGVGNEHTGTQQMYPGHIPMSRTRQ